MLATNLTISPHHHLTTIPSHHLCNFSKIVDNGVGAGFHETFSRTVAVRNADGHAMGVATHAIFWCECDTVLNHTGLYEYRHGRMLMHLRFIFEALSDLNAPGEYMRYYRQLRGLTTRQLAEKLNIVPATVLAYEQGRFPIPYDIAVLLAEELQISESLLFDDFCVFISAPYTKLLHTVRKSYGLSQIDFAEKADISPSIYAKWESGSRRPSRKMYQQLKAIYSEI